MPNMAMVAHMIRTVRWKRKTMDTSSLILDTNSSSEVFRTGHRKPRKTSVDIGAVMVM